MIRFTFCKPEIRIFERFWIEQRFRIDFFFFFLDYRLKRIEAVVRMEAESSNL